MSRPSTPRLRRWVALAAVLAAASPGVGLTAPADASVSDSGTRAARPEAWQPVRQQKFTAPAGEYCSFSFTYRPTEQDLESRVLARYPDGTVKQQEYRGHLVGTTTNRRTGKQITRDSSGDTLAELRHDGTLRRYTTHGPVGFGFRGKDDYAKGYYQLRGWHQIRISRDDVRSMSLDAGPRENICRTLR